MSAYHRSAEGKARSRADRARVTLPTQCARCGRLIEVGQPWDLGHSVDVVLGGADSPTYPEHTSCNRRAGGRTGARITNLKRRRPATPSW